MSFITLQLRRDTAANWTAANPTLASGELAIETDTEQFKIGNGSDAWNDLIYAGIQGDTGAAGTDGRTILSGAVDPTTEGADGDFYINTASSTLFGPKASGTWPAGVALIGADGDDGIGVPVGGTTGQALIKSSNTDYATEWGTVASSPGGSDTQVQFNDGGSFGGDAGLTFNKTSKTITLGGGTVTTSSPVIDAAQTWNDGAVTFTGLRFNATDTASAAGSLLMDLQVGGASNFKVTKTGVITVGVGAGSTTCEFGINANNHMRFNSTVRGINLFSEADVFVSSNTGRYFLGTSNDIILTRRGAANLRLGAADAAAPVAQTLSVQSVVASTTNTAGANLTITGSQGTGTGAGGSIVFQVAPAGSSGTAQNALVNALQMIANISGGGSGTQIYDNSGTRNILVGSDGNGVLGFLASTGILSIRTGQYVNTLNINASGLHTAGTSQVISFNGGYNSTSATGDTILRRDAANTLALRNGENAQAFNVYNTFTDASNYERGFVKWNANVLEIGTEAAGTGVNRNVYIRTNGSIQKAAGGSAYALEAGSIIRYQSGLDLVWSNSTNAHTGITSDVGILRASAGVLKISDGSTGTGALESASLKTDAPTGGTAATWKLGTVASVSPTSPNRTIEVDIGGTIYYLSAKTTND
jgi:hypothetical protein